MKQRNSKTSYTSRSYGKYVSVIKKHRRHLIKQYKVKEIGIFGSVVHGEKKRKSDIDILVDFVEIPDLLKFIELERYLEKIFRRKVDLVDKHGVRPELKAKILDEVLYV